PSRRSARRDFGSGQVPDRGAGAERDPRPGGGGANALPRGRGRPPGAAGGGSGAQGPVRCRGRAADAAEQAGPAAYPPLPREPLVGAGRGETGRLEVVSKSRRQALRSCAVGLFLVSKPHARRSGKAGTPFLRPLLALSSVGRESSSVLRTGIEPRCGSRLPCILAIHPVSPLLESRSPTCGATRALPPLPVHSLVTFSPPLRPATMNLQCPRSSAPPVPKRRCSGSRRYFFR